MVSNSLSCLLTPHSEESYDEGVKDGPFLPFDGQKQPLSLSPVSSADRRIDCFQQLQPTPHSTSSLPPPRFEEQNLDQRHKQLLPVAIILLTLAASLLNASQQLNKDNILISSDLQITSAHHTSTSSSSS